ncbi:MAG: hypothetical protein ABI120_00075 [Gemmatimonadaceae bacterium]
MPGKFAVAALVWMLLGIGQPSGAQSFQAPIRAPLDSQRSARVALPLEGRTRLVYVRLWLPISAAAVNPMPRGDWTRPVPEAGASHRKRNAIIGGVIGTVVGLGACTAISNVMDDSARRRVSTCTTSGDLIFGAGGFAVGALIGAAIR